MPLVGPTEIERRSKKYNIQVSGIKLTEGQRQIYDAAHDDKIKTIVSAYSRQSGKSTIVQLLCMEWLCKPFENIIYFTHQFSLAKEIYKSIYNKLINTGIVRNANATDLIITTINGSSLRFFSGENPQSVRGNTATKLIVDEAAFIKDEVNGQNFWFNIVFPVTKVKCNKIILISTPLGKSGFFYEFAERGRKKEKGIKFIKRTIYDDQLIEKEEIEEIKKVYPEIAFRCEYMCDFIDDATTYFRGFDKCFHNFEFDENTKKWIGIDLSGAGKDETIITIINEKNQVKQHLIKGGFKKKYKDIADIINNTTQLIEVYIENNGVGAPMIAEIIEHVKVKSKIKEFYTSQTSKNEIIPQLAIEIEQERLNFNKLDEDLYSQFGTFRYKINKKTKKLSFGAESGSKDDRIMSLAIALECKMTAKAVDKEYFRTINF